MIVDSQMAMSGVHMKSMLSRMPPSEATDNAQCPRDMLCGFAKPNPLKVSDCLPGSGVELTG